MAFRLICTHMLTIIRAPRAGINSDHQFGKGVAGCGLRLAPARVVKPVFGNQASIAWPVCSPDGSRFGKKAASRPTAGRNEQTVYTKLMLVKIGRASCRE